MGLARAGVALVLVLVVACGGGGDSGTQDKAACQAVEDAEGDEAVYDELRGMSLSSELRDALDRLEAASASGELTGEVMESATEVASLCREQGVELQG
jgi:hypothetical protein